MNTRIVKFSFYIIIITLLNMPLLAYGQLLQNWQIYSTNNSGLPSNNISALSIASNGNIWIGTAGGGLAKFDGTDWVTYTTANSGLPDNNITSLAADSDGIIWIGTDGGGLAKFDGTQWLVYTTVNSGLSDNDNYII